MSLVWHFSDIAGLADYVCFQGKSRHDLQAKLHPVMTQL